MKQDNGDLESIAGEAIGKIIFAFSQLELNINLCLQWAVQAKDFHTVNPLVERLSLKNKVDALVEIVEIKFPSCPECVSDFKAWRSKMDKLRVKRNSFVHGRWGFKHEVQEVVNVAPGMIGFGKLKEERYRVADLKNELLAVEGVLNELHGIRKRWSI